MMSLLTERRARKQVTETRKRTPPAVFRPELQDTEDREEVQGQGGLISGSGSVRPHSHVGLLLLQAVVSGQAGRPRGQDVQEDVHLRGHNSHTSPSAEDQRRSITGAPSHRHRHGHRARQAPDQGVVQGQPAEVRVPVALRVQSHRQTWKPAATLEGTHN